MNWVLEDFILDRIYSRQWWRSSPPSKQVRVYQSTSAIPGSEDSWDAAQSFEQSLQFSRTTKGCMQVIPLQFAATSTHSVLSCESTISSPTIYNVLQVEARRHTIITAIAIFTLFHFAPTVVHTSSQGLHAGDTISSRNLQDSVYQSPQMTTEIEAVTTPTTRMKQPGNHYEVAAAVVEVEVVADDHPDDRKFDRQGPKRGTRATSL